MQKKKQTEIMVEMGTASTCKYIYNVLLSYVKIVINKKNILTQM